MHREREREIEGHCSEVKGFTYSKSQGVTDICNRTTGSKIIDSIYNEVYFFRVDRCRTLQRVSFVHIQYRVYLDLLHL